MIESGVKGEPVKGHRQRLKDRFAAGDPLAHREEAIIELLLTYAIPQQDVRPLARALLATFGSLGAVLSADTADLCRIDGLKAHTAILLKVTHWIGTHALQAAPDAADYSASIDGREARSEQIALPGLSVMETDRADDQPPADGGQANMDAPDGRPPRPDRPDDQPTTLDGTMDGAAARQRMALFSNALLKDAVTVAPHLPETGSPEVIRACMRSLLHYNGEQTRQRYASYIARRLFPDGRIDRALPTFARAYAGRQELRDVCFYRFCRAEPLMHDLVADLLLPSIGSGRIDRRHLRHYLARRFPDAAAQTVDNCGKAAVQALDAAGIARSDRQTLTYAYRDVRSAAFAFVLHSEFPVPGMYDIAALEQNRAIRSTLWNPDRLLPALYELRNRGLISKVSEIDTVRQFTTRWTLDQVADALATGGAS